MNRPTRLAGYAGVFLYCASQCWPALANPVAPAVTATTVPEPDLARPVSAADRALHERLLVLDTHLDTPRHFARPGWRIADRHSFAVDLSQVDYPRMQDGGLDGGFWAIFTYQRALTPEGYATASAYALRRAGEIRAMAQSEPAKFELATTAADAERIAAAGRRIVFISIENAYPLGEDIGKLRRFYDLGVRMVGLVHSSGNQFADSATDGKQVWRGLSPAGVALVKEANRLGMIVDASHASDEAFDQMLALSRAPIILSHSGCRAVHDHPRNIDDARIKALAARGGVIQINTVSQFLKDLPRNPQREAALKPLREKFGSLDDMSVERARQYTSARAEIDRRYPVALASLDDVMQQMLHAIDLVGADHVGIGADWDGGGGVAGMRDIADLPRITARLRAAGLSEADMAKIMGGNALRVLRAAAATASVGNEGQP